jgi:undecaprenyl-diphosphatase
VTLFKAIVLGVIQGLTEFLPVSSHGHLVLAQKIMPIPHDRELAFDVALHLGTLVAVVIYFRRDLLQMAAALVRRPVAPGEEYLRRWWWLLGIATVPVAIAGVLFKDAIEESADSTMWLGLSFLMTAALLAYGASRADRAGRGPFDVTVADAVGIGMFQALALIPAVSRSGSTIAGGLIAGLDAPTSARFSFLLSVPAITAAIAFNSEGLRLLLTEDPLPVVVGTVVAGITGALAIEFMMRVVRVGRLRPFAVYCGVLGVVVLVMGLLE